MPFLRRFFGSEHTASGRQLRDDAAVAVQGLDIDAAQAAHQRWKQQLRAHLLSRGVPSAQTEPESPLDAESVCRDDRCDLGRWIHGPGRARLGTFRGFSDLLAHHRMFHRVAGNVLALAAAGKPLDARRMLDEQFEDYSQRVSDDLQLLKRVTSPLTPSD